MLRITWVRVAADLPDHPKSKLLAVELGEKNAWAYVTRLWIWCSNYAQDGVIDDRLAQIAESSCGWSGTPGKLLSACETVSFLARNDAGNGWFVHDWDEHQGSAIRKAQKDSERKRLKYEAIKDAAEKTRRSRGEVADSPRTLQRNTPRRKRGTARVRDVTGRDEKLLTTSAPQQVPLPDVLENEPSAYVRLSNQLFAEFKAHRGGDPNPREKDWAALKRLRTSGKPDAEILSRWKRGLREKFKAKVDTFFDLADRWDALTGGSADHDVFGVRRDAGNYDVPRF